MCWLVLFRRRWRPIAGSMLSVAGRGGGPRVYVRACVRTSRACSTPSVHCSARQKVVHRVRGCAVLTRWQAVCRGTTSPLMVIEHRRSAIAARAPRVRRPPSFLPQIPRNRTRYATCASAPAGTPAESAAPVALALALPSASRKSRRGNAADIDSHSHRPSGRRFSRNCERLYGKFSVTEPVATADLHISKSMEWPSDCRQRQRLRPGTISLVRN